MSQELSSQTLIAIKPSGSFVERKNSITMPDISAKIKAAIILIMPYFKPRTLKESTKILGLNSGAETIKAIIVLYLNLFFIEPTKGMVVHAHTGSSEAYKNAVTIFLGKNRLYFTK